VVSSVGVGPPPRGHEISLKGCEMKSEIRINILDFSLIFALFLDNFNPLRPQIVNIFHVEISDSKYIALGSK